MSKILHITSSIRGDESVSRTLSTELAKELAAQSGAEIINRDLSKNDIPFVSADRFAANGTAKDERTPGQQKLAEIADTLISEFTSC